MSAAIRVLSTIVLLVVSACGPRQVRSRELLMPLHHQGSNTSPRALMAGVSDIERREGYAMTSEVRQRLDAPMGASDVVFVALHHSPRLQAAFAQVDVALADLRGARRVANPEAEVSAMYARDSDESPALELTLLFDLSDAARVGLRSRVADAAYERARVSAAGAAMDTAYRARISFLELLAARARVALLEEVVEVFRAAYEQADAMRDAGNLRALDVAQQRALYEESRASLAAAELAALDQREQLNALLGLFGDDTEWTVGANLADVPSTSPLEPLIADFERDAVARSIELAAARFGIDALERQVGLERSRGAAPAVHAGVSAERTEGSWELGPVLEVELPVFDQNQGGIGRAAATLVVATHQLNDLAVQVRANARRARNRVVIAHQRARFLQDTLIPARQEVLEQALLQYNAMNLGVFDLLRAKRQHVEALLMGLDTRLEFYEALAAAEQILAGRMVDMPESANVTMVSGGDADGGH